MKPKDLNIIDGIIFFNMRKGVNMERNKPILLNYKNLKAIAEISKSEGGFIKVIYVRNSRLYLKNFRRKDFKNIKELYVVGFIKKYLEDLKNKKQSWYYKHFVDFMINEYKDLDSIVGMVVIGYWQCDLEKYIIKLGVIITNTSVSKYIVKKYNQQGWDLVSIEE